MTILALFVVLTGQLFGQDTTVYKQANAAMFSNNYTFIKNNKNDKTGIFIHSAATDDMLYWYGIGHFSETKHKLLLSYDTTNCHNHTTVVSDISCSDTLQIQWFDWWGNKLSWFSIQLVDSLKKTKIHHSNLITGTVKIPKMELTNHELSLYSYGSERKIFTFPISKAVDKINLFVNDPETIFSFPELNVKAAKNNLGFKTKGMWTHEKETQFIITKRIE